MKAKQWLVENENLFDVVCIENGDWGEMVKIQLDITYTWWLAEEDRLMKPITWDIFNKSFTAKLFPQIALSNLEQKFNP